MLNGAWGKAGKLFQRYAKPTRPPVSMRQRTDFAFWQTGARPLTQSLRQRNQAADCPIWQSRVSSVSSPYNTSEACELKRLRVNRRDVQNVEYCQRDKGALTDAGPSRLDVPVAKPLEYMPASELLEKVLSGVTDARYWRRCVAQSRTARVPIVLLQDIMREEADEDKDRSELLDFLPPLEHTRSILRHLNPSRHSLEALEHYKYILRGRNDDERCRRYLENPAPVPPFIFLFLIRYSADLGNADSLSRMIESSLSYCNGARPRQIPIDIAFEAQQTPALSPGIDHEGLYLIMRLLLHHCLRLDPRMVVKLADTASEYIQNLSAYVGEPRKLYLSQCKAFNRCLEILQPLPRLRIAQRSIPNIYFWEAQKILLSMSASLPHPLLISKMGFRAIRNVLSGQAKNSTEIHSSARHAPTWPPYLQPGHGMDERADPEDNWSRTVSAGMLMQEAGFAKGEIDEALDTLQGMTTDGSPTIQQRRAFGNRQKLGIWEASIRATRNAREAWARYTKPPESRMKPNIKHYAAMFEKLVLREAEAGDRVLPGDKAMNFPTKPEANLAEFEIARLRPPSISELYQRMRLDGIAPHGNCLRILVANAESSSTAHQYLWDSCEDGSRFQALLTHEPDPHSLRAVPLGLFSAYVQLCLRVEGHRGRSQLKRVMRLADTRLERAQSRWVPFIWGNILKSLSQHHKALGVSLAEQLKLIMHVTGKIEANSGLQALTFTQFNKCIRKVLWRELRDMAATANEAEVQAQKRNSDAILRSFGLLSGQVLKHGPEPGSTEGAVVKVLRQVGTRMKETFWALANREKDIQRHLESYQMPPLERMNSRIDAVRREHAHEYMLALGYLGEVEEMGRLMNWLVDEWAQTETVSALMELDEPPPFADFSETMCLFRMVAEPILGTTYTDALAEKLERSGLNWAWPDDETVAAYADVHHDEDPTVTLRRIIEMKQDRIVTRHSPAG